MAVEELRSNRSLTVVLIIAVFFIELLYLLYLLIDTKGSATVIKFITIGLLAFVPLFFMVKHYGGMPFQRYHILMAVGASLLFQLTLLPTQPEMSDDIYRYVWDGKVQCHGISPYRYAPDSPKLFHLHSEDLPEKVNFPAIKTVYPPIAQSVFSAAYLIFGESVTGLKFILVLFGLGAFYFLFRLIAHFNLARSTLLWFCWNPLLIMEIGVNGHLDIVMITFVLGSLYHAVRCRYLLSALFLALAVGTKLIPAVLVPVMLFYFFRVKKEFRSGLGYIIVFLSTLAVQMAVYFESLFNMVMTATNYSSLWYFNNPLFYLIHWIVKSNEGAHIVSFSILMISIAYITVSSLSLKSKWTAAVTAFLVCNPTLHPWYLLLPLSLALLDKFYPMILWSFTVFFSYTVVMVYKTTGHWEELPVQLLMQYIPLFVFFVWRGRRRLLKN